MIKTLLQKASTALATTASVVTLISFAQHIKDKDLKAKLDASLAKQKQLSSELDALNTSVQEANHKTEEAEKLLNNLNDNIQTVCTNIEKLGSENTFNDNSTKILNEIFGINKKNEGLAEQIKEILSGNSNNNNNFIPWGNGSENILETLRQLKDNWLEFFSTLTIEQQGAIAHLLASISILLCLFSIIIIVYSDILIKYFKIEEKYPRLGKFIKIRRLFQQYYLFYNFTLIIIVLFLLIYVNFSILIKFT